MLNKFLTCSKFFKLLFILKTFLINCLGKLFGFLLFENINLGFVNCKIYFNPRPFLSAPNGIQIIPDVIQAKNKIISSYELPNKLITLSPFFNPFF